MNQTVTDLLAALGGKHNIKSYEHCATRLRVVVIDESLILTEKTDAVHDCKGYFFNTGQHQFVFGTGAVNKVYAAFGAEVGERTASVKESAYAGLNPAQKVVRIFADILVPLIPVLVTTGLLMGVRGLLLELGVSFSATGLMLFGMLTDTAFAFLPVLIAYSATKKFGGNPLIGIVVGLMMVAPQLPNAWVVAGGGADPLRVSFLGLNLSLVGYQGSILPAILAGYLVTTIEKQLRRFVPNMLDLILTPFLTITLTIALMLFALGPITHGMEKGVAGSIMWLIAAPLGIGYVVFAALQQVLVITGLHHSLGILEINALSNTGYNVIQPLITASMAGQFGAAVGATLLMKDKLKRTNALSSTTSSLFGITEPLLFGINLRSMRVFGAGMAGGAVGGMVTYVFGLKATGMGITFIPGLLLYVGSGWGLLHYVLVIVAAFSVGFLLVRAQKGKVTDELNR